MLWGNFWSIALLAFAPLRGGRYSTCVLSSVPKVWWASGIKFVNGLLALASYPVPSEGPGYEAKSACAQLSVNVHVFVHVHVFHVYNVTCKDSLRS